MLNEYDFSKAEKVINNVQTGDSTTTASTTWRCPYIQPKAEQGWECPRCGHINAPWVRQCDCSRSNWTITCDDLVYRPKEIDKWLTNVYQVGGSGYKAGDTYVNIDGAQSNSTPNSTTTAWNTYSTNTIHNGKINYKE